MQPTNVPVVAQPALFSYELMELATNLGKAAYQNTKPEMTMPKDDPAFALVKDKCAPSGHYTIWKAWCDGWVWQSRQPTPMELGKAMTLGAKAFHDPEHPDFCAETMKMLANHHRIYRLAIIDAWLKGWSWEFMHS